jgi:hypothetical protein
MRFCLVMYVALFTIGLIGCQKEYSLETDQSPAPGGSGLLLGATLKDNFSEVNFDYEYNASNLPTRNIFSANAVGLTADGIIQVTRDAAGKPNTSMIILESNLSPGADTINYEIKRNAAGKVNYVLLKPADTSNTAGYDSIIYSYDASGKMAGYLVYLVDYSTGLAEPMQAFELTYSGGNVVKSVEYELPGTLTPRQLVETISYFYDSKPAARVLTEDDFIANLAPVNNLVPSVNNCVKYSREYAQDPAENVITEYNYVYRTDGKPISAEVTTIRPGLPDGKATLTFTYR